MAKSFRNELVKTIEELFLNSNVLIIENNDGFLMRQDIQDLFDAEISFCSGDKMDQRFKFEESKLAGTKLVLLNKNDRKYLADMEKVSYRKEVFLKDYFSSCDASILKDCSIGILERLYVEQSHITLGRQETKDKINKIETIVKSEMDRVDIQLLLSDLKDLLKEKSDDWKSIIELSSKILLHSIGTESFQQNWKFINEVNDAFQEYRGRVYKGLWNSSQISRPKIVSGILPHLQFKYKSDRSKKVALIVIDGMSWWQYEMIKASLPGNKEEHMIFSWLPSITQLSRQAIFRGGIPIASYRQSPSEEKKLWKKYWSANNIASNDIAYFHSELPLEQIGNKKRLAFVDVALDSAMHACNDLNDLKDLTKNWIERECIGEKVKELIKLGFELYLTTDHGNIQARKGKKINAQQRNLSKSRSERHLELGDLRLVENFNDNHQEILESLVREENVVYFKDDKSFSGEKSLVSHGGAHMMEVLIPFVRIYEE